jgi:glycerol-3-phosphate O-acyltransferase/dihydroxyacetone phosphate acyltransferase
VIGEGTKFTTELKPRWQIMLPKNLNSCTAEVTEIISDTEVRVKKEFGGDSGKATSRFKEKVADAKEAGVMGLPFRRLPFVDQQDMYQFVYKRLKEGGLLGIFPEGQFIWYLSSFGS